MTLFDKGSAEREISQEAEALAQTEATPEPAGGDGGAVDHGFDPGLLEGADPSTGVAGEEIEADSGHGGGRSVPFSALKAERTRRQHVERDLHTLQGQVKAWQNAMMSQLQSASGPDAAEPPNAEQDPLGALRYTQQQLAELQAAVASQVRGQQLHSAYVAGATSFSREHPDFAEAYNHMIQSRANELRVLGAPEGAIARQLRVEEEQMVAAAVGAGRNPAEIAYAAARARGWTPRNGGGASRGNGDAAGAAASAGRAAAAVTLGPGGRASRGPISAEDLSRLSGRDFDAGWERLFGRRTGGNRMFAGR